VPTYKGGIMDGAALEPDQFRRIARLPGLEVLHGQLLGAVASPVTGVTRGLNQLLAGLAGQLGQIQDQGLVAGEPEAEKAEPDTDPAEAEAEDSAGNDESSEQESEE
jgi:large subunit ribosomal protein L10